MSSVVDERVVQMSFDNDKFEKGVAQTINSLDTLNTNLEKLSDGNYFEKIESGIDRIANGFTESGMIINGVLLGIGRTIETYLLKTINLLSAGIRNGLSEYNTQMDSTQTILGNVKDEGKGIVEVTEALDNLNEYADKTIYNFTEMTRNIGMFTAAGTNLNESVATIKGLANAAALAGANSVQASRAWYQVSQAMAAGTFRLMDWRSLENASIAGEAFQKVLMEVARKDGIAIDEMIKKHGAFRYTLEEGWLTAGRFAEAMSILSGDINEAMLSSKGYTEEQIKFLSEVATTAQEAATKVKTFAQLAQTTSEAIGSGWAKTFRIIVGDFEKARKFFTRISNVLNDFIGRISDFRNDLINSIMNDGGINSVYNSIKKTIDHVLAIFTTFFNAARAGFMTIFPKDRIVGFFQNLFGNLEKLTRSFVLNSTNLVKTDLFGSSVWDLENVNYAIGNLIRIFRDLFAAIDSVWIIIRDIATFIWELIPGTDTLFDSLEDGNKGVIESLADILDNVAKFHDVMLVDYKLIPKFLKFIQYELEKLSRTKLVKFIKAGFDNIILGFKTLLNMISSININPIVLLTNAVAFLGTTVSSVVFGIASATNYITELLFGVKDAFVFNDVANEMDQATKDSSRQIEKLGKNAKGFKDSLHSVREEQRGLSNDVKKSPILSFIEAVGAAFLAVFDGAVNRVAEGINFIVNLPAVAALIEMLEMIWSILSKIIETIDWFLDELHSALKGTTESIFKVLAVLGVVFSVISTVFAFKIVDGLLSFTLVLGAIANDINAKAFHQLAESFLLMAIGLGALTFVDTEKLLQVSIIMGVLVASLYLFMNVVGLIRSIIEGNIIKKAVDAVTNGVLSAITALAKRASVAIVITAISSAILKLAMSFALLALVFEKMPNGFTSALESILGIASVLGVISVALAAFTKTTKSFIDIYSTGKNIKTITGIVAAFSQFFRLLGIAAVIRSIAISVTLLSVALRMLSDLSWDQILPAFTAIGSLTLILSAAATVMAGVYTKGSEKVFSKIGLMFLSIGIAISAIFAASSLIKSQAQIDVIIQTLISTLVSLFGFLLLAAVYSKVFNSEAEVLADMVDNIFVVALSISAVMVAMSSAMAIIKVSNSGSDEFLAVIAFLVSFGTLVTIISKITAEMTFNIVNIAGVTGLIYSMVAGVLAIALALKLLDGIIIDTEILITFGIMSSIISMMLAGIIGLLGAFPITSLPVNLPAVSALMLSVVASVVAIAASLRMLSDISIDSDVLAFFTIITTVIAAAIDLVLYLAIGLSGMAITPLIFVSMTGLVLSMVSLVGVIAYSLSSLSYIHINPEVQGTFITIISILGAIIALIDVFASIPTMNVPAITFLAASALVVSAGMMILEVAWALQAINAISLDSSVLGALTLITEALIGFGILYTAAGIVVGLFSPELAAALAAFMAAGGALYFGIASIVASIGSTAYLITEALLNIDEIMTQIQFQGAAWIEKVYTAAAYIAATIPALALVFIGIGVGIALAITGLAVGIASMSAVIAASVMAALLVVLNEISKFIVDHPEDIEEAVHNIKEAIKIVFEIIVEELKSDKDISEFGEKTGTLLGTIFFGSLIMGMFGPIIISLAAITTTVTLALANMWALIYSTLDAFENGFDSFDYGYNFLNGLETFASDFGIEIDLIEDKLRKLSLESANAVTASVQKVGTNLNNLINDAKESLGIVDEATTASSFSFMEKVNMIKNGTIAAADSTDHSVGKTIGIISSWESKIHAIGNSASTASEGFDRISRSATGFAGSSKGLVGMIGKLNYKIDQSKVIALNASKEISKANIQTANVVNETTTSIINDKVIEIKAVHSGNIKFKESEKEKAEEVKETNDDMWSDLIHKAMNGELTLNTIWEYGTEAAKGLAKQFNIDLDNISVDGIIDMLDINIEGITSWLDIKKNGFLTALGLESAYWTDSNTLSENQLRNQAEYYNRYMNSASDLQRRANKLYAEANATIHGGSPEAMARAKQLQNEADMLMAKAAELKKAAAEGGITTRQMNDYLLNGTSITGWFNDLVPDFDEFYKDAVGAWNNSDWSNSVDVSGYNYKSSDGSDIGLNYESANKELEDALKGRNDILDDYAVEPEDWTPVINLDQLKNEVNQANGIMTGSLLAAQNAAIGDYINTDSELNPFLKDRWKTTYNFTQNNYSPKALSRIEIYRQTQNQLRISRGF